MQLSDIEINFSSRFFTKLRSILGVEKSGLVENYYSDLYFNHPWPQNPILEKHLIEGILPGLALYQVFLREGMSKNEALEKVTGIFLQIYENRRRQLHSLGKIPFIYDLLRMSIKTAMKEYPSEGWSTDWIQSDRNAIRFNMKDCFYYNTLSAYQAHELTASFCQIDDHLYGDMSPFLQWKRTQTIGRGSPYCDFCFLPGKNRLP